MEITKVEPEVAKKIIDNDTKCYMVLLHDLEKDCMIAKNRVPTQKCLLLIDKSKTITYNKDIDDEDSYSIMSLYTAIQNNIMDIRAEGLKYDVLIFNVK